MKTKCDRKITCKADCEDCDVYAEVFVLNEVAYKEHMDFYYACCRKGEAMPPAFRGSILDFGETLPTPALKRLWAKEHQEVLKGVFFECEFCGRKRVQSDTGSCPSCAAPNTER
jgi:hypothetical protein